MAIRVSCPSCKSDVHVDESLAGKDILCPSCKERLTVPSIAAGQPQMMPGDEDEQSFREGAGPGGMPRWGEREDEYDLPSRRDPSRWNATVTGLNLIFWTGLVLVIVSVIVQAASLAMGNNPQMFGPAPGAQPPAEAMAFGLGMMAAGCVIIVLAIVSYVGMCMCCTVPSESGARGKAIATVVLIAVSVVGGIVGVIAMSVATVAQIQKIGGPPPPGVMPFPAGPMIAFFVVMFLDFILLVTLWLLFLRSIAHYFRNDRLSKLCIWFIVVYAATTVVNAALNFIANPIFTGGNLLEARSALLMVAAVWGLVVMVGMSAWYLYINRETKRTILEDQAGIESGGMDE